MAGSEANINVYDKTWNNVLYRYIGMSSETITITELLWRSWNSNWDVTQLSDSVWGDPLPWNTIIFDYFPDVSFYWANLYDVTLWPGCHQEDDYSAMRGPCPEGFHVPMSSEWRAVKTIWTTLWGWGSDWTNFGIALKLPFAGYRAGWGSDVSQRGTDVCCWSSTWDCILVSSSRIYTSQAAASANGYFIRPFKDTPVIPDYTWVKLYWTSIESWWIFWHKIYWVISISSDWANWITIADKNLWATTVWNNWDTLSEANCGWYFQWWNNYMFPFSWSVTTSSTQVDASTYGPWNYYSSSTFITKAWSWDSSNNLNLWWWETWVTKKEVCPTYTLHWHIGTWHMEWVPWEDDYSAMRGPCDEGYHVPLSSEWGNVYNIWTALWWGSSDWTNFWIALKIPFAGRRLSSSAGVNLQGTYGFYWSSSRYNANNAYSLYFGSTTLIPQNNFNRAVGFSVRCFKDVPVEPTLPEVVAWPTSSGAIAPSSQWPTLSLWTATKNCTCIVSWSLWSGGTGGVTYADLYKNWTRVDSKNSGFITWSVSFEMQVEVSSGDVLTLQTSRWSSDSWAVNNVYVLISNWWSTLYDWSSTATWAWIFHNATLWLISLSSDWQTWITIADKNLWATTVWNSWDTLSEANCGKYFQWWNNYGFPWTWSVTTSSTQVDASTYWPGNYYSSSTFITYSGRRDTTDNWNLWWWETWVIVAPWHYKRRTY